MSLETIRGRLEAATPGPWTWRGGFTAKGSEWTYAGYPQTILGRDGKTLVAECYEGHEDEPPPHADLIAHAPTDLKLLLAVAEAAKALRYTVTYHDPGIPGEDGYVGDPPHRPGCHPDCDAVEAFKAALDALEAAS